MRKPSITRRLIVSVLATQLVLTIGVVSLAAYITRRQLRRSFDAALHGRAMSIAALVRFSEEKPGDLIFDSSLVPPPLESEHPDFYKVLASDGHLIASSPIWPSNFPSNPQRQRSYWTVGYRGDHYRLVQLEDTPVLDREGPETTSTTITVIYAASTEEIRARLWMVVMLTCAGSFVLLAISTVVSVWAVQRGLSPLSELATSAGRVTTDNWELDIPDQVRATQELVPLTCAMEEMLATLQQAFASQKEFVANAAHELKTPVAVLKSTLQLLLQQPRTAEEYRIQLEGSLDDLGRLEALTHSLLRLARAEQAQRGALRNEMPHLDVTATCEQSAERFRPLASSKSVQICIAAQGSATIHAEPEDIELIWSNLFENAIRYSTTNSSILVSISTDDHYIKVDVTDSGPGIGEADLPNIFDRFQRADASRSRETGGYGLGLAIVKAMVEAYGGSITAESRLGRGTTMSVRLPSHS
jgi:signal transduction histidine kinase